MNWYSIIKLSQIWNTEKGNTEDLYDDEVLPAELYNFYELEYKYSMLKNKPFSGLPVRRENMMNQLRSRLVSVSLELRYRLINVYGEWLSRHAILNPEEWGKARAKEGSGYAAEQFDAAAWEYIKYKKYNNKSVPPGAAGQGAREIMTEIERNPSSFPSVAKILETSIDGYKQMLEDELYGDGYESFGERWGQTFQTEEQAQFFIDNLNPDTYDLLSYSGIESLDSLANVSQNLDMWEEVLADINAKLIFPHWYAYWSAQGIDDTRANIEDIYITLQKVNPESAEELSTICNRAINAAHQTGSMLEYLQKSAGEESDSLDEVMKYLSSSESHAKWDEQLTAVGVKL